MNRNYNRVRVKWSVGNSSRLRIHRFRRQKKRKGGEAVRENKAMANKRKKMRVKKKGREKGRKSERRKRRLIKVGKRKSGKRSGLKLGR